jgi:hypothetical protein
MTSIKNENKVPETGKESVINPVNAAEMPVSKVINPEHIEHARQLSRICQWYRDYCKKDVGGDGCFQDIQETTLSIESAIGDIIHNIGELVSFEFTGNVYWDDLEH